MLPVYLKIPRPVVTGYFGNPGTGRCTKVHIVDANTGVPVCQSRISEDAVFQWCAPGAYMEYVECLLCKHWKIKSLKGYLSYLEK